MPELSERKSCEREELKGKSHSKVKRKRRSGINTIG
jgi:hypothetical protein